MSHSGKNTKRWKYITFPLKSTKLLFQIATNIMLKNSLPVILLNVMDKIRSRTHIAELVSIHNCKNGHGMFPIPN